MEADRVAMAKLTRDKATIVDNIIPRAAVVNFIIIIRNIAPLLNLVSVIRALMELMKTCTMVEMAKLQVTGMILISISSTNTACNRFLVNQSVHQNRQSLNRLFLLNSRCRIRLRKIRIYIHPHTLQLITIENNNPTKEVVCPKY